MGRAVCKKGLRIVNFEVRHCVKQTPEIEDFYAKQSVPLDDSMRCCHGLYVHVPPVDDTQVEQQHNDNGGVNSDPENGPLDDFNNFEPKIMEAIDAMLDDLHNDLSIDVDTSLPEDFDMADMWNKVAYHPCFTPLQTQANTVVDNLKRDMDEVKVFMNKQAKAIQECVTQPAGDTYIQKEFTAIYTAIHKHQISGLYYMHCQRLMKTNNLSKEQKHICFRMFVHVREILIRKKTEDRLKEKTGNLSTTLGKLQ